MFVYINIYILVHFYTSLNGAHNHDSQSLNPAGIPAIPDSGIGKTVRDWKPYLGPITA